MIELRDGMVAHAKKVDLHIGDTVVTYSAPRGKSFAVLLLGAEKPSGDGEGIQIDKWLTDRGWKLEDECTTNINQKSNRKSYLPFLILKATLSGSLE